MSDHRCPFCYSVRAFRSGRYDVFALIHQHEGMPNNVLAERTGTARQTVIRWRRQGERRGCVPVRVEKAKPWTASDFTLAQPTLGRVYPIGTVWTDVATARAA